MFQRRRTSTSSPGNAIGRSTHWHPSGTLFTVGRQIILTTAVDTCPSAGSIFDIAICAHPNRPPFGTLSIQRAGRSASIHVSFTGGQDHSDRAEEAARLALRVAIRQFQFDHAHLVLEGCAIGQSSGLEADGLYRQDEASWVGLIRNLWRPSSGHRAMTMEDLYGDPLFVPWNFLPRPAEILDPLRWALEGLAWGSGRIPRVLDLGCGYGANAVLLENDGADVWGADLSSTAIKRCRELVNRPSQFVEVDVAALPFDSQSFDIVLDVGCIHCVPASARSDVLSEINRVLKSDGRLLSRIYKPRDQSWIDRQPFEVSQFGMTLHEVESLFQPAMQATVIADTSTYTCVVAKPRHRD